MSCRALRIIGLMALIPVPGAAGPAIAQTAVQERTASIRVLLPSANAQLSIDDVPTRQTGAERVFVSPPLEAGRSYTYTVSATWQPNNYTTITRTRKILVKAGQDLQADLRPIDDKQPDKIVIRYVPTPQEVVEAMLKLADVGK